MVSVAGSSLVLDGERLKDCDHVVVKVGVTLKVSVAVASKVAVADNSCEKEMDLEFGESVPAVSVRVSLPAEMLSLAVSSSV